MEEAIVTNSTEELSVSGPHVGESRIRRLNANITGRFVAISTETSSGPVSSELIISEGTI